MMMLLRLLALSCFCLQTARAVPAIVWAPSQQSTAVEETVYTSREIPFSFLERSSPNTASVVFLLARNPNGDESLSPLAPHLVNDDLRPPTIVHQHITGVESASKVARSFEEKESAAVVTLDELESLWNATALNNNNSPTMMSIKNKRTRAALESTSAPLIVQVPANVCPQRLSRVLASSVQQTNKNTIVSAIRSTAEVKAERDQHARRKLALQSKTIINRRRLEEQDADNQDNDMSGVYYVSMTPNLFAGILFFWLFALVTFIGVSCMNNIAGQDVYVKKMPAIGREA